MIKIYGVVIVSEDGKSVKETREVRAQSKSEVRRKLLQEGVQQDTIGDIIEAITPEIITLTVNPEYLRSKRNPQKRSR